MRRLLKPLNTVVIVAMLVASFIVAQAAIDSELPHIKIAMVGPQKMDLC